VTACGTFCGMIQGTQREVLLSIFLLEMNHSAGGMALEVIGSSLAFPCTWHINKSLNMDVRSNQLAVGSQVSCVN
jgi:hypothetical protein